MTPEQLGTNLVPRHRAGRILIMRIQAILNLLELGRRERSGFGTLGRNTVPDVLDKLDPLGDGEAVKIRSWLTHIHSIQR